MSTEAKEAVLRANARLSDRSDAEIHRLALAAQERVVAPGVVLQHGGTMVGVVVLSGDALVDSGSGVSCVGEGDLFGGLSDPPEGPGATVTALTLMHLLIIGPLEAA